MQTEVDEITPVLKWAGGKRALLPSLLPRVPRTLRTYAEPFAGGAALFFALASEVLAGERAVKSFVLCDANPELANLYRVLRSNVDALIAELQQGDYANTPERFAAIRAARPTHPVERAARFKYLNATCFNGLHRVNKKGEFNVPFGKLANPTICDPERLRAASRALALATIHEGDFTEVTSLLGRGDMAYCDPPYVPTSATANFTGYAGEFGPEGPAPPRGRDARPRRARLQGARVEQRHACDPIALRRLRGRARDGAPVDRVHGGPGGGGGVAGERVT